MSQQTVFEKIKRINAIGQKYWSARELFSVLEYIKWDKFLNVIAKAKEDCKTVGKL
jgi:DNA-damage-inducible protein D